MVYRNPSGPFVCPDMQFFHVYPKDPNSATLGSKSNFLLADQTYVVLLLQLGGERSGHANAALAGGSREVSLAGLAPRRGET